MNILVIGNGFDLAHELPTTYQDFLKFTDNYRNYLENDFYEQMLEVKKLIDDNTWIKYFKNIYNGNGWVDFEKEISNIIQIIDKAELRNEDRKGKGSNYLRFNNKEIEKLVYFDQRIKQGTIFDMDFISQINDRMQEDLNNLTRCLEIYLGSYIKNHSIEIFSPNIKNLDIDKVLSFNYTDTFARLYNPSGNNNIEYDYIHGKAEINHDLETNNMVLGIDEYLSDDRKNKDIEFIAFKKYYQRIYKGTGCKYKDWINEIEKENNLYIQKIRDCEMFLKSGYGLTNEIAERKAELEKLKANPPKHNLYIFGHSLDMTDKDILRELILIDNVYTTIFYPTKKELGRKIANLVQVIHQDELIRRTGRSAKTIVFEPQQGMVKRKL